MKTHLLLLLGLCSSLSLWAQPETLNNQPGYTDAVFLRLAQNQQQNLRHTDWDIAFQVNTPQGLGIFINEGQSSSSNRIRLYEIPNQSFGAALTAADLGDERSNPELDWGTGAFNTGSSPSNPFDLGWGLYNPVSHAVTGHRLYALELRDGSYLQLQIDSLVSGVYYFRYANLDGTNSKQAQIAKSDFPGKTLAYFSFASEQSINAEPADWDLLFTRYETTLDNNGVPYPYPVLGVLQNSGVEVAVADNIDPNTVDVQDYQNDFRDDSLAIIGYDWKNYDFQAGWTVDLDRVYFVRSAENQLWKLRFIDFQGSSSGVTTFVRKDLGTLSSVEEAGRLHFQVYPNPVQEQIDIVFELETAEDLHLQLIDLQGRVLLEQQRPSQAGLNAWTLQRGDWPAGLYILRLQSAQKQWTSMLRFQ